MTNFFKFVLSFFYNLILIIKIRIERKNDLLDVDCISITWTIWIKQNNNRSWIENWIISLLEKKLKRKVKRKNELK